MAERRTLQSTNPATGETFKTYPVHDSSEIEARLERAGSRRTEWRTLDVGERGRLLHRCAALLRDRAAGLAELMAREMGKPVAEGRAEAEKCAWACEHFAEHGASMLAPTRIATDARDSYVVRRPLGAVLGVMPWNFPLWQVFRFAAPTLMAGNVVVLKHASNVPGCAEAITAIFTDAGFPDSVFTNLAVESRAVDQIIANPIVAAVSVTGSREAGSAVAASAGAAIKKSVLELGGSDAYLVLEDADLELAARACAQSRLINGGQSCIAAKRFIVVAEVIDEFTERLIDHMRAAVVGDPLDDATNVGPLARVDLRDSLHRQVADSVAAGARCLLGGAIPEGPGAWYPVTVLDRVLPGMPAFDDETFGPVAAIVEASSAGEAVRLANAHRYGLGAAVFTRSIGRGQAMAERDLEAGFCVVNDFVRSDPRLPFGGVKESGYGRELGAIGIREFVNEKTVYVA